MTFHIKKTLPLYETFLFLFLFFCIFFPQTFSGIRFALFIGLVLTAKYHGKVIATNGSKIFIIFLIANIIFFLYGLIRGNDFSRVMGSVRLDILYPILFLLGFQGINEYDKKLITKTMVIFGCLLSIIHASWVVMAMLGINQPLLVRKIQDASSFMFGKFSFMAQYYTKAQQSLAFLIPFLIVTYILNRNIVNKYFFTIGTVCCGICFLFSGRVAIYISTIIGVVLALIKFSKKINVKATVRVLAGILLVFVFILIIFKVNKFDISSIINYITEKITRSHMVVEGADSTNARTYQRMSLVNGWKQSPIFGAGSGAVSQSMGGYNWSERGYEYIYYLLLFQKGIVGSCIYFAFYLWIIIELFKRKSFSQLVNQQYAPMLSGLIAILIAGGTNPYFVTMGSMWMIYIPYAFATSELTCDDIQSPDNCYLER